MVFQQLSYAHPNPTHNVFLMINALVRIWGAQCTSPDPTPQRSGLVKGLATETIAVY